MKALSTMTFALAAALAAPAAAQTPVDVPAFRSVSLLGGGHVTLRHGPVQRVTLLRGSTEVSAFEVGRNGELAIRACRSSCRDYELRVEIVTPDIEGLAIRGGGRIEAEGGFAAREGLGLAVTGGGRIDARSLPADTVAAAVRGGGNILTHPRTQLTAAVTGGGAIRYLGDPRTTVAINGGGGVQRIGSR